MIYYNKKTNYDNYDKYALRKESFRVLLNAYKNLNESWKIVINDLITDEFIFDVEKTYKRTKNILEMLNDVCDLNVCSTSLNNPLDHQVLYKTLSQLHSKGVSKETMIDQAYNIEYKYGMLFNCIDSDLSEILKSIVSLTKKPNQIRVA